jgi:hypothetical protein
VSVIQEAVQPIFQTGTGAIGQPDDFAGHRDGELHAQRVKTGLPLGAQVVHQALALLYHELTIARGNDFGSKEARCGTAQFAMGFALLEQDRCVTAPGEAICKIRHETGLTQPVATKDLTRQIYATNPDRLLRYVFDDALAAYVGRAGGLSVFPTLCMRANACTGGMISFSEHSDIFGKRRTHGLRAKRNGQTGEDEHRTRHSALTDSLP